MRLLWFELFIKRVTTSFILLFFPSAQTALERRKNSSTYGKSNSSPLTGVLSAKQGENTNCSALSEFSLNRYQTVGRDNMHTLCFRACRVVFDYALFNNSRVLPILQATARTPAGLLIVFWAVESTTGRKMSLPWWLTAAGRSSTVGSKLKLGECHLADSCFRLSISVLHLSCCFPQLLFYYCFSVFFYIYICIYSKFCENFIGALLAGFRFVPRISW